MALKVIASALVLASAVELKWSPCSDSASHPGTVTDLQPTSLNPGAVTSLTGKVMFSKNVSGGAFKFEAYYVHWFGRTQVQMESTGGICEDTLIKFNGKMGSLFYRGLECPLSPGEIEVNLDVAVATVASDTPIDIELSAVSDSNDKLVCVQIQTGDEAQRCLPILPAVVSGSVLAVSIIFFICWWWRKRRALAHKKMEEEANAKDIEDLEQTNDLRAATAEEIPLGKVAIVDDNASTATPADLETISQIFPTEVAF